MSDEVSGTSVEITSLSHNSPLKILQLAFQIVTRRPNLRSSKITALTVIGRDQRSRRGQRHECRW